MAMLQVAVGFSTLLFSLGLDQAYVREFHEAEDKAALLKCAVLPGLILLLITLVLLISRGGALAGWLFERHEWYLTLLVVVAILSTFISRFLSLILRMSERGLAFSMSQVLPKLLLLGVIGLYVIIGEDKNLNNLLLANTLSVVLVSAIFAFNTRADWAAGVLSKLDIQQLKSMLMFGLPLILGGVAFWGLTAIDKLFLRTLANFEELGIYSVSVSFAAAATILQSIFTTVWIPTVYKWVSKGDGLDRVLGVIRYALAVVVIAYCLAGLLSWILTLFLPIEYGSVQWIVVSCLGYPLLYTLSETTVVGIGVTRRSIFAMLPAIVAFAVNCIGNWLLIPRFGAAGAAVSTSISFWVFFILRTELSIYVWKPIPRGLLYTYTTILVAGAAIFTLWGQNISTWMYIFWFLVLISSIYKFKTEVHHVFNFFFSSH
ncbi:oligosaccharide flippase family protein [Marinobacterium sp. D7]|nr:oligosaccharide flippase family protein [Marinobacterium ramblicola]